jgi:DNA-binding transcriptional regulator LsrR (DeoR family)
MKMNTKDLAIAVTAAQGLTQEDIAAKIGMSQTTVSRRLKRPEVKSLIEEIQIALTESTAEKTKEIIANFINSY